MILIIILLGVIMIIAALYAIHTKDMLTMIIASGVVSLMASVLYVFLHAPDVAMTEATIGSGLTTVVFLYALKKVGRMKGNKKNG